MNKFILCMIALSLATILHAQDLSIKVDKKGKVGYADSNGNIVIKCQYETATPFSDGIAIVAKSGKYGIIDTQGKVVLPLKYSQISNWSSKLFLIKAGKTMGLANHFGKIVLPVKYTHITKPNCYHKALIAQGGKLKTTESSKKYMLNAKYGIIDVNGNIVIAPKYRGFYEFAYNPKGKNPYYEGYRLLYSYHYLSDTLVTDCEYLGFSKNAFNIKSAGIMDGNGKEILKQGLYDYVMKPSGDMVRYYIAKKKETICGYHNLASGKGFQVAVFKKAMDSIEFWSHGDFTDNIAPVNGNSWSFINKYGQSVRSGYSKINHAMYSGIWAALNSSGKWEVFDEANIDISSLSGYNNILFCSKEGDKEVFTVSKGGKWGCISRSGETVVPFNYEQANGNTYDFIPVKNNGKWGAVTPDNKEIVPAEYVNLLLPSERNFKDVWVQQADSLYYHYSLNEKLLSQQGYKRAMNFKNGYAFVTPKNMTVVDNMLNRALLFEANTSQEVMSQVDFDKSVSSFGIIVNSNNQVVFSKPLTYLYFDVISKEIEKNGGKPMTEAEMKNILLKITEKNRSYKLNSLIGEEDWNY